MRPFCESSQVAVEVNRPHHRLMIRRLMNPTRQQK